MSERLREAVRRSMESLPAAAPPPVDSVHARAKRLRRRRNVGAAVLAGTVVTGTAVVLASIGGLGGGRGDPNVVDEAAPTVVTVECGPSGVSLDATRVAPQPDGVHLRYLNGTGKGWVQVEVIGVTRLPTQGYPPAPIPPGVHRLRCIPAPDVDTRVLQLEVLDTTMWLDPALECRLGERVSVSPAVFWGGPGEKGEPEEIARRWLRGSISADAEAERAGYVGARYPIVRVVDGGRTVAAVGFTPAARGGWYVDSVRRCVSEG